MSLFWLYALCQAPLAPAAVPPGDGGVLLMEDDTHILLEDNTPVMLEG